MREILQSLKPFSHARHSASVKRRSCAQRPCVDALEVRALLATFYPLGTDTSAVAVSADGSTVVGNVTGIAPGPFCWTKSAGVSLLRNSSGNSPGVANAISGNGSVIVGTTYGAPSEAWRWTGGFAVAIPQLTSSNASSANSLSTDGSIIAGDVEQNGAWGPFVLTGTTLEPITLPPDLFSANGTTMSANGAVVAVNIALGMGGSAAYQWANGTLTRLPGSSGLDSVAIAVSPDGSVVIGSMHVDLSSNPPVPFEWTNGAVTALTPPPGYQGSGAINASATGASDNGSTIVGYMATTSSDQSVAFIYNQASGVQDLQQILTGEGLGSSLTGWTLTAATAITPDGNTIVGDGIDPQGQTEGWIARLNATLQSITVTPANPSITVGATQQFIATGNFSDNSTEILTSQVTWASATPSVATISTMGLARAVATGTSSITASLNGVTGAAMLTVTPTPTPTPTIAWPAPAAITYGTALSATQLDATASFGGNAVPGTFTYTPTLGTVLNAGQGQTLAVSFTPSDTADYKSTTTTTELNVLAAPLTVAVNPATRFYGQANPAFTVSYSGFVLGQGPSVLAGALAFGTSAVPSSNVGSYAVQASDLSAQNYSISYEPGILSVDPTVLTFTAVNKVRKFKAANPRFTFTDSGFVLGQSAKKVLKGTPVLSTTAKKNSPVGQDAIVIKQGTLRLTNRNYTFKFVNGLLQVIGKKSK